MPEKAQYVIERGGRGMTYRRTTGFTVYALSVYERTSVLAGQQKRVFIDDYPTLADAQAAYPQAELIEGTSYQPPYLDHLPDDDDY